VRKIRAVNLKVEISEADIERGVSVMSCKVSGCETVWVLKCYFSVSL
jgi:hypothetical protein